MPIKPLLRRIKLLNNSYEGNSLDIIEFNCCAGFGTTNYKRASLSFGWR